MPTGTVCCVRVAVQVSCSLVPASLALQGFQMRLLYFSQTLPLGFLNFNLYLYPDFQWLFVKIYVSYPQNLKNVPSCMPTLCLDPKFLPKGKPVFSGFCLCHKLASASRKRKLQSLAPLQEEGFLLIAAALNFIALSHFQRVDFHILCSVFSCS